MNTFTFSASAWLPLPIEKVFEFFSDAHNLESLTPPFLKFRVITPDPIVMTAGTHIRYKLKLRGIPIHWESEITIWEPPDLFVDEQLHGPYRLWRHEHRFAARDGGTEVSDHVEYAVFGGSLINRLLVAPDVRKIFAYRQSKLSELLLPSSARP